MPAVCSEVAWLIPESTSLTRRTWVTTSLIVRPALPTSSLAVSTAHAVADQALISRAACDLAHHVPTLINVGT
jgi:hypothetical protein